MNIVVTNTGTYSFKPLRDRLLVKRIKQESIIGGLWVPDVAQENSQRAEIVALGPKCRDLEVGDTVLLPGVAAKYPDWESCDYMLVQQADVGGILT